MPYFACTGTLHHIERGTEALVCFMVKWSLGEAVEVVGLAFPGNDGGHIFEPYR